VPITNAVTKTAEAAAKASDNAPADPMSDCARRELEIRRIPVGAIRPSVGDERAMTIPVPIRRFCRQFRDRCAEKAALPVYLVVSRARKTARTFGARHQLHRRSGDRSRTGLRAGAGAGSVEDFEFL